MLTAILAVFALSAVAATAAFAESEWLEDGAAITTAKEALLELMTGLKLKDTGTGVEVECEKGESVGKVGAGAKDEVTSATCTKVNTKATEGSGTCTEVLGLTAVKLPWKTEIVLSGTAFRDLLIKGAYLVKCKTILGTVEDECVTTNSSLLSNSELGSVESLTDGTTETESPKEGTCSLGKEPVVLAGASLLIVLENGLTLTVS